LTGEEITVAVATCGRPESLARCLRALASGTTRPRETIVVDQAPSPDSRRVVEQCGIEGARYLEQPRLGVSASRNLALAAASGVVLAVIDDDCAPDPGWVTALAAAFERDPTPTAVTGPILPLGAQPPGTHAISLRTATRPADHRGRMLPWIVGSGGNFAAWREVLAHHAGWDERLGPGSPGQAAEDAELLYRILRDGGMVRYEPAAVVRHEWQTWARRLATRSSYGHGIGALCGVWLRRGDSFAARMLAAYAKDHLRALAGAAGRRNGGATTEHGRALAGLLPGLLYGLRLRGGERPGSTYDSGVMSPTSTDALGTSSRSTLPSRSGDPERHEAGSRRVVAWSIATLLITVASVLAVVADWRSPVRTVLALVFLLFAPGLALTEMLAIREPAQRLALVAGASLGLDTVVALTLVYAHAFSINLALILLAGLTLAALAVARLRGRKLPMKSRDRRSPA
jgi:GT2 family glycosyltransferase